MRIRAAVLIPALLLIAGCGSIHDQIAHPESLRMLQHLKPNEPTSFGVILDAGTGKALSAFRVNKPIRTAIADGEGGWYVGGGFIRLDGQLRRRLAHIRSDGTLDPDWKPEANGSGVSVTALARLGSRLYVAGDFAKLQHEPRLHLGALDIDSARLAKWRAPLDEPFWNESLLGAGSRLIVGGSSCCSEAGSSVVALDAETGALDTTWRPRVDGTRLYGDGVYLLTSDGRGVLIHGLFGRPRGRVVVGEIDSSTGELARKWTPRPSKDCRWCTLMAAAVSEDRVFASINGSATNPVLAFSRRNGALDSGWGAQISSATGFYGAVSAFVLSATPSRVYIAGDFDRVNGHRRHGVAALDPKAADVLPSWTPSANSVYASLLAQSGSRILLGVELSPQVQFNFTGLKTYRAVQRLELVLGLSGPGSVRIGLGRDCDYEQWVAVTGRCSGPVTRWLGYVRFSRAGRRLYEHDLQGVPSGPHFVRFVPQAGDGKPQLPTDFWFRVR